ncbi:MAG: hypothetical protein JO288_08825 [Hyphomicrobiales bacterium]|nr:hypothetical protein [Hyphomicrobiales bacterium]
MKEPNRPHDQKRRGQSGGRREAPFLHSSAQIDRVRSGGPPVQLVVAGQILRAYGAKEAYPYIGAYVTLYAIAAIVATYRTPETKAVSLER